MYNKHVSAITAAAAAAAMLMTTCFGSLTAYAEKIDLSKAQDPNAAAESTTEAEASGAQELTFVLSNEPDSIDPTFTSNSFAAPFITNMFEGLVGYDKDGNIAGEDAESWEASDDLKTYTFHLRDNLKWSDGSDLTANDYVYAAKHVCSPDSTAQYLTMITDYVVGAEEYFNGDDSADFGVKALDDHTLEYDLKQPCPYFVDLASMWVYYPLKEDTVEANGDKWTQSPDTYVGNGPFRLTEINPSESYVMEKNPNYWDAENVTLEKVTFRYILDTSTALTAYENGEVDGIRSIPSGDVERMKTQDAGFKAIPSYGTVYYNINCSKAPYDDPNVRKALCLAIDRADLINNVVQLDAQPAYSFLAPGYVQNGKDITEGRDSYGLSEKADPEAAKAALAEAGYDDPSKFPTLHLSFYSDDTAKKVAEALAEMIQTNLGIKVEVSSADWSVFYSDVQNGNYEVAAMGWSADYTSPMSFLPLLYTDDTTNTTFYSNKDYDAAVDAAKTEADPDKFAADVMEADKIASNDYAVLPLYYKSNTYLMHDYVSGDYMATNGSLYLKNAKVSK